MKKGLLIVAIIGIITAGCAGGQFNRKDVGTVVGGALGGFVGSQIGSGAGQLAATAAGAIAGALIGSSIGESMDELDRRKAAEHAAMTLWSTPHNQPNIQYGSSQTWQNPNTGQHYRSDVTVGPSYKTAATECREYKQIIILDRKETPAIAGTACKNPHTGEWEILK
ncbi:glycine zipper 2TM domain-containing protein [bacterium]|nr:glycine zipper 2TM domain-containing protein [bacterium]MCI0679910.1 glycine zipper 2TM domain-containing protein [bacterium]